MTTKYYWDSGYINQLNNNEYELVDFYKPTVRFQADSKDDLIAYVERRKQLDAIKAAITHMLTLHGETDHTHTLEELYFNLQLEADALYLQLTEDNAE